MGWYFGSVLIVAYSSGSVPPPPFGFFLLTDFSNFLLTDMTPLLTAGA